MSTGDQARWRRIREIFDEAAEAESSDRRALVAERCQGDLELRREVEDLLHLRKEPGLALDRPPVASPEQQERAAEAGRAAAEGQPAAPRYGTGTLVAGRYRIERFLARGGMGEVYEAFDVERSRPLALKFVRQLAANQGQLESRFLREVRMARRVEHPNACRMFEVAEHEGERFCAMELLHGETLAARLARDGKLTPSEALPIACQLCDGLAAAHRAGVLHRDLKPGNVFLESDRAVIIDFGLAAASSRDATVSDLTASGAVIGTLAYMAPEQLEEGGGGAPADLYSLGVIFYEMLTGEKPHDAKSPFRLAAQKARESHRTPSGAGIPGMPAVWREVITRSLKAHPAERYPSADAMKQALERGRPSAHFVLAQRRVLVPAVAMGVGLLATVGWQWAQMDHKAPPAAARLYEQASEAMTTAAPARAVKLLDDAIALDPQFVNARSLLAVAHAETDQLDRAKDSLLAAITTKDRRWSLGRGEKLGLDAANAAIQRDFAGAASRYEELAKLPGQREFALLSRARMLDQAGKRDEAIRTLETAIAAEPDAESSPAARVRLANLLCRKRAYERATAQFNQAEAAYRKRGNQEGLADLFIARSLSRTQDRAADRADLERAIALSEKTGSRFQNFEARLRMVTVTEREHDYERAIVLAREVVADAQREGMPVMAARATGELGYAYVYLRKWAEAEPILRESVAMAERAKSYGLLASNRSKLGEVLGALRRVEEAVTVLEPAVRWYRQAGVDNVLPLTLIKWGTVLSASSRFAEAEPVFREAYALGKKNDEELYVSMALQRLADFNSHRSLRRAAEDWDQAVVIGRRTRLTKAYFQAADGWLQLGEFRKAQQLVEQGEKEATEKYPKGADQDNFLEIARFQRVKLDYLQGRCDEAAAAMRTVEHAILNFDSVTRRIRACVARPASLASDLDWFEGKLQGAKDSEIAYLSIDAGDLALRRKDWEAAKRYGLKGVDASRARKYRVYELENTLVLRAAEAQLGHHAERDRLTTEVLKMAAEVGFPKPSEFGGRQDLLYFWRLGSVAR